MYLKERKVNELLQKEMQRHGVFFAESRELSNAVGLFPDTEVSQVNGKDVLTWKYDSASEKVLSGMETTARVTGKAMSWVENNINRNSTFRVAFAQRHKQLNTHRGDIQNFIRQHPEYFKDTEYGDTISKKVENHTKSI